MPGLVLCSRVEAGRSVFQWKLFRRVTMSQTRGGSVGDGQISVRKSSKRSRFILGAAVAGALAGLTASSARAVNYSWTGTAGGPSFWDANSSWTPNTAFPGGSDGAIFGAGAVDFRVDLHAINQNVNTVTLNNATGSYLFTNGALTINSGLTQSGAATNTIEAQVITSGPWTISGGTMALTNTSANANNFGLQNINVGSGATLAASGGNSTFNYTNAANGANVALANGATFRASGVLAGGSNQLLASYYDTVIDQGNLAPGTSGHKFDRLI